MFRDMYGEEARANGFEWEDDAPVYDKPRSDEGTQSSQNPNRNKQGGENEMTEVPVSTEGLDVDLTHEGAVVYRRNSGAYDELTRDETQALGAANLLHRDAGGEDVDIDLDEAVDYIRENDLVDTMRDYKRRMPDDSVFERAAESVVDTLDSVGDYMDEAQTEADRYIPVAEEQSDLLVTAARNLDRAHQAANDVSTTDYTFAEDLRQSRENVLGPNEEEVIGIMDDMEDRL